MQDRLETARLLPDDSSMPSNPDTLQGERKAYGSFNDDDARRDSLAETTDDEGIIPKDALDPVYEAKARILNRAVRTLWLPRLGAFLTEICSDSRYWHGKVSVGIICRHWIWMG